MKAGELNWNANSFANNGEHNIVIKNTDKNLLLLNIYKINPNILSLYIDYVSPKSLFCVSWTPVTVAVPPLVTEVTVSPTDIVPVL